MRHTKTVTLCLLTSLFLIFSALPVLAADKGSDEETLGNATTVLQAMLASKGVPAEVLAKADCLIVLPRNPSENWCFCTGKVRVT
jgi:hypothetical protein